MTTVSIHMAENLGLINGFTLYLRKTSDGTLVNTGGDALAEEPPDSGRFVATVAEAWTETLAASVVKDSNGLAERDGWLAVGETIMRDVYPNGDATVTNQTTIINHLTDIKGAGWSSTTDTLEKIRDAITAALDAVVASAGATSGALTGWPETMSIGDSYTDDCSRSIHLFVRDASDDPITSVGSHAFTDADFTATVVISQGAQRGRVIGTATWEVGPEGYLNVQIPSKESRRAAEGTATVQVLLRWTDSGDQYTLPATTTRWIAQL